MPVIPERRGAETTAISMNPDPVRDKVLSAREARASLRESLAQSGYGSISLSLNIPGYPKTTPPIAAFFEEVLDEFKRYFQAHRIVLDTAHAVQQEDEAGNFFLAPIADDRSPESIKDLAESFEKQHPLGRLIDIDIADRHLQPISSGRLKQCLLCEKPALVCMREANHGYEALREHIANEIRRYLMAKDRKQTCRRLAALALKAILYEVSASPKPGLVGRFEQGAHHDMDYFTFVDSTSALAGYFEELALSGIDFEGEDLSKALPIIRTIGLKMEAAMFAETRGVNTQKGLIFLIGLALFSAARCIANDGSFSAGRCRDIIAGICANLVQTELATATGDEKTHGILCYQRYGSEGAGVRKEAEDGLPTVFEKGLPELTAALAGIGDAAGINRALLRTLLRLMTTTRDSNIVYRKDLQTLQHVRRMAQHVLDTADATKEAARYEELLHFCGRAHISPGGSADLLAVTIFIYFAERSFSLPSQCGRIDEAPRNV